MVKQETLHIKFKTGTSKQLTILIPTTKKKNTSERKNSFYISLYIYHSNSLAR